MAKSSGEYVSFRHERTVPLVQGTEGIGYGYVSLDQYMSLKRPGVDPILF